MRTGQPVPRQPRLATHGHYSLWDTETANLIGWWDDVGQACRAVLEIIELDPNSAKSLILDWEKCGEAHDQT